MKLKELVITSYSIHYTKLYDAVLSGPAHERIKNSGLTELFITDSIPVKEQNPKITVLSVAQLFADTIEKVYNYQSISNQFLL